MEDLKKFFRILFGLWSLSRTEEYARELREKEDSYVGISFLVLLGIGVLNALVGMGNYFISEMPSSQFFPGNMFDGPILLVLFLLLYPLFYLFIIFLFYGWSYMWIKVFGGDLGFKKTVTAFVMVFLPFFVINLVLNFLSGIIVTLSSDQMVNYGLNMMMTYFVVGPLMLIIFIFSIIVFVKAMSILQNMSIDRIVLTGVVALGVVILLLIVLMVFFVAIFGFALMSSI